MELSARAMFHWVRGGQRFSRATVDATAFVPGPLCHDGGAIAELEVRRASLEDTYLVLVRQAETTPGNAQATELAGAAR